MKILTAKILGTALAICVAPGAFAEVEGVQHGGGGHGGGHGGGFGHGGGHGGGHHGGGHGGWGGHHGGHHGGYGRHGYYRGGVYVYDTDPYYYDGVYGYESYPSDTAVYTCSQGEAKKNVARVDSAMVKLANTRLAHSSRFNTRLREIAKIQSTKERSQEYLRLAGVQNPSDNRQVMSALSEKADHTQNLRAIEANFDLSSDEAKLVLETARAALRGQKI